MANENRNGRNCPVFSKKWVNSEDDTHPPSAFGTGEGVDLIDLLNQRGPVFLKHLYDAQAAFLHLQYGGAAVSH
jgi:hypothetical protein